MAFWRSLEGTLTLTERQTVEVVVVSPQRFGWPMLIDTLGRQHDMHWLQRTRAWRRSLGYRPPGDAIVVVADNVWTLRRAAMVALGRNCAPPQIVPPADQITVPVLRSWAALTKRIVHESLRNNVPLPDLMLAAYEAAAATRDQPNSHA